MTMPYSIVYVYKLMYQQYSYMGPTQYLYMYCKIMLWVCHYKILEKLKIKNPGPIVLI